MQLLANAAKDDDSPARRTRLVGIGRIERMQRSNDRELREELVRLRAEHRALDDEIVRLEESTAADQLQIKRLKKKKLILKDQIQSVEDQLLPDIIA